MTNFIGQSLGRYHILEQLGEGGMATVYKAYDTRLERDVAVKVIRVDQFGQAVLDGILKRFDREAKVLAKLSHPNIVGIIDYGEEDGTPYLVMEYLPGGTLKKKLGKPIPYQEAIRLLIPMARALDYAHRQGMVHRDVKPSNIITTSDGDPMLTDFGIAKILESRENITLTGTGAAVGTPEYMAPEQWTGEISPKSDIYSLGVVLYEMVTGHKPYTADTPAAVLLKQANEPLPRPRQYIHDLPDSVEKVLLKALAKKPDDRFPDMGSFAAAMEALFSRKERTESTFRFKKIAPDLEATVDDAFLDDAKKPEQAGNENIAKIASPEPVVVGGAAPSTQGVRVEPTPVPPAKDKNLEAWERIITERLVKGKNLSEVIAYLVKSGWKEDQARALVGRIDQRIALGKWERIITDYFVKGASITGVIEYMVRSGWKEEAARDFAGTIKKRMDTRH